TKRPKSKGSITDDNMTLTATVDNGSGGPLSRNFKICFDQSVINPKKGVKEVTGFWRAVGGGAGIMNPTVFPQGRTILRLEVSTESVKTKMASIVNKLVVDMPIKVLVDDPSVDTDPCFLDASFNVDDERQILGLRRRAGSPDDNAAEAFFIVQSPNVPGDSLNVRFKGIDMPKPVYTITGLEMVGGEFGGSGLPG